MYALAGVGFIVGVLGLLAISAMWKGYVLTVLWGWFVVPTFGLPVLALAQAIGMSLVVSFLTHQSDATKEQKGSWSQRFAKSVAYALLMPALVLGIGAVVRQFM
jgi:hypothetical protein